MHVMSGESAPPGQPGGSPDVQGRRAPPPPPPPPAPPPPPPLVPPLPPGAGQKKRRVRSFFWKTIPEDQVKGRANLWTQGGVRQQYQIDVRTVEELFGQSEGRPGAAAAAPGRGLKARGSFREAREEVSFLDSKRGMNLGIFLKQFRRPNQAVIDDLHHGNSEAFGAEPLRELLKLLPDTEEVAKLRSYGGDVARLPLADSFMHALVQLPSFRLRIDAMLLKEEFPAAAEAVRRDVQILRSAAKELMCCDELHAVLHLVLQAGNILNAGGYAGGAVGFKLSSLVSLVDTKANRPGMNLLHFVALEAEKIDRSLLDFPVKLRHVQAASRISVETLDAELQWLTSRTRSVDAGVRRDGELLSQLDGFLQNCAETLAALRGGRQQLQREGGELLDFFCEDPETFRLNEVVSEVQNFCWRFTHAAKENEEREVKEERRRRRVQELEEQKRHSWAGGEQVGGAFGLRCSSETDMSAAASRQDGGGLLVELLAAKPRPRSPGRSGSLRRSRNSPSGSPGAAAERELSAFLETAAADVRVPKAAAAVASPRVCNANDSHQQRDHRDDGDGEVGVASSSAPSKEADDGESPHAAAATAAAAAAPDRIATLLQRCTLVQLQSFSRDSPPSPPSGESYIAKPDRSGTSDARLAAGASPSRREEDEAANEEAAVWCVAGVCEEREGRRPSSPAATPRAESQPANEEPAPVLPISSQPLAVARGDGASLPASPPDDGAARDDPRRRVATSSKTIPPAARRPGVKPAAAAAAPTAKSVRTLTGSERQGLRRVVPISRNGRGAPPAAAAARPATAPSSRRSSVQKTADPGATRSRAVPGSRASAGTAEEKVCRSALRALSHGGGSVSAPATPLHRAAATAAATTPPRLPGFARSTAASSFRQTRPAPPPPPASGSSSSTSSSIMPRRSQSVRDSRAPPRGPRRNDSTGFPGDPAAAAAARPGWR